MSAKEQNLDDLIAAAELGKEATDFLKSDLGKVMLGLAQQEVELAKENLETVDPKDEKKITEYQNHAKVGRWFEKWLVELVSDGENALNAFKAQQHTD